MIKTDKTLAEYVKGKRVAVVGNAHSLFETNYGSEIDDHDIVIRINRPAIFFDNKPYLESHGSKIDIWMFWDYDYFVNKVPPQNSPERLIQHLREGDSNILDVRMALSRRRFTWNGSVITEFTCEELVEKYTDNKDRKNFSTGLLALVMLNEFDPAEINIYGFDFKHTHTFNEIENHKLIVNSHRWDMRCSHEYAFEEELVFEHLLPQERFNLKNCFWERE